MRSIPSGNAREIDLRHLRVLEVLLAERNLTRAADVLKVTQPALSKTLAALRQYFSDPLFVRVGNRMEPTAKALELKPAMRAILDQVTMLRTENVPFDPARSARVFTFSVVDSGIVRLLPPLLEKLERTAPRIGFRIVPLELERIELALESGQLDFAMGSYTLPSKRIRRQKLWNVTYTCVVREDHPRVGDSLTPKQFAAERHIVVTAGATGHAHQLVERALERAIPPENIVCRVPTFVTAAVVASTSDVIVTLPAAMATTLAERLRLRLIPPPLKLPKLEVSQYWHERFHRDPGNQWVRGVFAELFRDPEPAG
ncbi:MAG TPA: LysR family transcriptional regulator [Gammaproteobacteria bacterium]